MRYPVEDTFKCKTKSQGPTKWIYDKRIQIFIEFNTFLRTENLVKNSQNSSGKDGSNKKQRSNLIYSKIRISHTKTILHRKINCYLIQKLTAFFAIKITDEDSEVEMTKEKRERLDRKLWKKKFPGGIPLSPVSGINTRGRRLLGRVVWSQRGQARTGKTSRGWRQTVWSWWTRGSILFRFRQTSSNSKGSWQVQRRRLLLRSHEP